MSKIKALIIVSTFLISLLISIGSENYVNKPNSGAKAQDDFNEGTKINIDITTSPGNLKFVSSRSVLTYRMPINVTNSGSALKDYQVLVKINSSSLISAGKMRKDCGDIRFKDSDGTQISYWLESGCNSSSTYLWAKVPYIPASSTKTIYVYYGNLSLTTTSNVSATFIKNSIYAMSGDCSNSTNCCYMDNHIEADAIRGYTANICKRYVDKIDYGSVYDNSSFNTDSRNMFYGRFRYIFLPDVSGSWTFATDSDDGSELVLSETDMVGVHDHTPVCTWYGGHWVSNSQDHSGSLSMNANNAVWFDYIYEDWGGKEGGRVWVLKPNGDWKILSNTNFPNQIFARNYASPEPTISVRAEEELNVPPEVEIIEPKENSTVSNILTIKGKAWDINTGDKVEFVYIKIGEGVDWKLASGTENWYYILDTKTLKNGKYTIYVKAYDGELFSEEKKLNINVHNNHKPVKVGNIPKQVFNEDGIAVNALNLNLYFYDEDNDPLNYSYYNNLNVHINISFGFVTFSFRENWYGEEKIIFNASDGEYFVQQEVFVEVLPLNDPPILNLKELNATEDIEGLIDLSPYIIDVDNKSSDVHMSAVSKYIKSIIGFNITFLYPNGILNDTIEIILTDGIDTTILYVYVSIMPVNDPPILTLKELNATEDIEGLIDLSPYIIDVDNKSSEINMSAVSRYIKSVIGFNITFLYPNGILNDTIEITLTDGINITAWYIYVSIMPVNDPPFLEFMENITVKEGDVVIIEPIAHDEDTKELIINISGAMNSKKWRTKEGDAGVHKVTIAVSDGEYIVEQELFIFVLNVNTAPIPKCKYRKEGREVFFDGSESYDLDNDTLKFEWEFGDGNKGYGKNIVHKYLKDGKYKVVLTVSDGNLTTSTYILVKIEKKAIPGFTILMALIVIAFISRSSYISSHLPFLYLLN